MGARNPKFLTFTDEEYGQRLDRARRLMAEQRLDALLVSAVPNIVYLTGYRSYLFDSNFRPFLAVIPRDGDPTLLLPNLELGIGEEYSPFADVRAWGATRGCIAPDAITAARDVITEKGLAKGRIGIEQGAGMRIGMGLDQFAQLKSFLPDVEWPNSAPLLWQLRRVKSPAEVASIRESQRITDAAYHAALDLGAVGVSERDLQRVLGTTMMQEGADKIGMLIVGSGPDRYKMANPYPSDRKLESGDMVIFDLGCVYNGYWSDITRGYFVGGVSDDQRRFYEAATAITEDAVKAVKPGVTCAEVDRVAEQSIVDRGYKDNIIHRTGHSLGLEVHEIPSIAAGDETVLEPGMVVTIEPGIYDFTHGAYRMEDLILVTETGHEYLSHARRELTVK
jgi:Xaa-Pro aminopeptidase